jgi:hypothetical protein
MNSPPSSATPGIPSQSNAKYVVVAVLLLLGIAAILLWKFVLDKPAPIAAAPTGTAPTSTDSYQAPDPTDRYIPLPPPEQPDTGALAQRTGGGVVTMAGSCDAKCTGTAPPELSNAMSVRAAQARACYNQALATDPTLKGNINIGVKVSSSGGVCSSYVAGNDMGGSGGAFVAQCAANVFRGATYPAPKGGCVDVSIPLSFRSR